jgi:hypothetical protein
MEGRWADSSFSAIELIAAVRQHVCFITCLRLDANLFAPAGDLGTPAPLDGVVHANDQRVLGQELIEDHHQQFAGNSPLFPACLAEHMVVESKSSASDNPMMRSTALTVRMPGVGTALAISTSTWSQIGAVKTPRKAAGAALIREREHVTIEHLSWRCR